MYYIRVCFVLRPVCFSAIERSHIFLAISEYEYRRKKVAQTNCSRSRNNSNKNWGKSALAVSPVYIASIFKASRKICRCVGGKELSCSVSGVCLCSRPHASLVSSTTKCTHVSSRVHSRIWVHQYYWSEDRSMLSLLRCYFSKLFIIETSRLKRFFSLFLELFKFSPIVF